MNIEIGDCLGEGTSGKWERKRTLQVYVEWS
jgi:hypothetical protein